MRVSEQARAALRPLIALAVLLGGCTVEQEPMQIALEAKKPKPDPGGAASGTDSCGSAKGARAYARGYAKGYKTVDRAWNKRVDDCDRLEPFLERALARIERIQGKLDKGGGREQRLCRLVGQMDGAVDAIDAIQLACGDACMMHGGMVGNIAAITYCELALEGAGLNVDNWMRGRVNLCGLSYETGCDAVFLSETSLYTTEAGACIDYTVGDYELTWDRTRTKACAYDERPDSDRLPAEL